MPVTDLFPGLPKWPPADGMPTAYVAPSSLPEAGRARCAPPASRVLLDAIPVDLFPREPRFEIVLSAAESGRRRRARRRGSG